MKTLVFEKNKSLSYLTRRYSEFIEYLPKITNLNDYLYDYKIHELNVGDCPARPIWHYDGTNNPIHEETVNYHLFLSGDAICPTEFFVNEISFLSNSNSTEDDVNEHATWWIKSNEKTFQLPYDTWYSYTNKNLHCATHCVKAGTRILIRMKENILSKAKGE